MHKSLIALAPLALTGILVTSWGGSQADSAYCKDLETDRAMFYALGQGDIAELDDSFAELHKLADEAPEEVADEWKVVIDGITTLTEALEEAGLSLETVATMQPGELPKGVDIADVQAILPKLQEFGGAEMNEASEAIDKHANEECGFTLYG